MADEADRLRQYLRNPAVDQDSAPLVGGASRMQQMIDELLAGAASRSPAGVGLPF